MTKSSKSKILALALCAGVMSGIYASPVLAAWGNENVSYDKGSVSSDIGDLNNPSLHHPNGPHDDDADCGEEVDGTDVKIGDLNKVIDDLVANDTKVANELSGEIDKINEKIEKIDVEDTDTHVKDGTYEAADNGDVTMDIVDKNGNDTGKDVNISGLASDKELGEVDDKAEQALSDAATADGKAEQALAENDVQDAILDAHGQQIGDNTAAIKNHTSVIGVEDSSQLADKYADTNYISDATSMVEADQRLDAAISDVSTRVDGIENRVDGLEDRIDKVGAMSAAIANLRTMGYDPAAPTEIAVGVGQYRDETGMALGLFHYPNRDFMLSLSVSTSGDEYMGGIGATWKFGRKSPEKVAEIKKAQAEADARRAEEQKLAKAEEMKKAAKEAKVQAQMERHAKLAAERAALEEA